MLHCGVGWLGFGAVQQGQSGARGRSQANQHDGFLFQEELTYSVALREQSRQNYARRQIGFHFVPAAAFSAASAAIASANRSCIFPTASRYLPSPIAITVRNCGAAWVTHQRKTNFIKETHRHTQHTRRTSALNLGCGPNSKREFESTRL